MSLFLSTLSLRRATVGAPEGADTGNISIHALLAESDVFHQPFLRWLWYFYPRSPCGERHEMFGAVAAMMEFLSTLSLRRATEPEQLIEPVQTFLSTLSLRRATIVREDAKTQRSEFLSTLSLRRATGCTVKQSRPTTISIHALLAESDPLQWPPMQLLEHFYPRSPCGERLTKSCYNRIIKRISIHALLAESDMPFFREGYKIEEFLSTLSLRRATGAGLLYGAALLFLSTLSLRRATMP